MIVEFWSDGAFVGPKIPSLEGEETFTEGVIDLDEDMEDQPPNIKRLYTLAMIVLALNTAGFIWCLWLLYR